MRANNPITRTDRSSRIEAKQRSQERSAEYGEILKRFDRETAAGINYAITGKHRRTVCCANI